jgi:hypothetical protein
VRLRLPTPALLAGAGVVVATAVAVAAVHGLTQTEASPISPIGIRHGLWIGGIIGAFVLYLAALLLLRHRGAPLVAVIVLAVAVQLAPLAAPLLLSRDAFVYWDYGRIATVHNGNPYRDLPSRWPADPAYSHMGSDWHRTYDAYGPAWTLVAEADANAAGGSAANAGRIFKWVAAAGMLALVGGAAFAARRRSYAAAFVGWNPLLALHSAGGGHNDAWMMAFTVGALGLGARQRRLAAGASWALAVAVKWLPLIFLPLEVARRRARFPWIGLVCGFAGAAVVSSIFFGPWWVRAVVPVSNQLQRSSTLSSTYWLAKVVGTERQWTVVLAVVFAFVYLWLLREAWRGRTRFALCAGLFCLSLSWLTPWYATWALALAAIEEDAAGTLLALALTGYVLWDALPL